jgi:PIN domain nuclease of toxin-antitoxin system
VILLDTHIWRWWVGGDSRFTPAHRAAIDSPEGAERGISAISCWEIAKAVETGHLALSKPVDEWMDEALRHPGVTLLPLTPEISIESTRLPAPIHKDPGDQLIIATARVLKIRLLTADERILAYAHVEKA